MIFILTPVFLRFYSLSSETKQLVIWLVLIHNVFNAATFPFSGALSNGLRAALFIWRERTGRWKAFQVIKKEGEKPIWVKAAAKFFGILTQCQSCL